MRYLIALPKEKRLRYEIEPLFNQAGFGDFETENERQDNGFISNRITNETYSAVRRRSKDALKNIELGLLDAAVVGMDSFMEIKSKAENDGQDFPGRLTLIFEDCAACRLSVAAKYETDIQTLQDLNGLKVATSYPETVRHYLNESGVTAEIYEFEGGIESYAAGEDPFVDAVVDIVDTGKTLTAYGLEEKFSLFQSSAVLVTAKNEGALTGKVRSVQNALKRFSEDPCDKIPAETSFIEQKAEKNIARDPDIPDRFLL